MNVGIIKSIKKTKNETSIQINLDNKVRIDKDEYNLYVITSSARIPILFKTNTEIVVPQAFGDLLPLLNKKCEFELDFNNSSQMEDALSSGATTAAQSGKDAIYTGAILDNSSIELRSFSVRPNE